MSQSKKLAPVYLKAMGAVTSVGLTNNRNAAAVRASISSHNADELMNKHRVSMTVAFLPDDVLPSLNTDIAEETPMLTSQQERIIRLADLAIDDLKNKVKNLNDLPLFLAGSETLPKQTAVCYPEMITHLSQQVDVDFSLEHSKIMPTGRAGGLWALQHAMAYVQAGYGQYAIVGGIDSYFDLYLLRTLDKEDRILADGVRDGFAPGEGAGFFIISHHRETFEDTGLTIQIFPPGLAEESGHRYSQEPYRGDGLAQAFTLALDNLDLPAIKTVLASLNGENFGAKELGVATTRNSDRLSERYIIFHPAENFGDIGAAFFPVSVGLIAMGFLKKYIKGPVLSYASSEAEFRGAACLVKSD